MSIDTFNLFLGVMSLIALFVFIALYFVKAGYGIFRTASWGVAISNKLAWILMEAPVFVVMAGQQAIVQIHQRLGHDAFKLDQDGFFHPLGRSFKLLGVGIGLGRIIARLILARTVFVPRLQDHRVLGQRHRAALGNRSEKDRVEGLIDALLDIPVCMIAACLHSICPLSFIIR